MEAGPKVVKLGYSLGHADRGLDANGPYLDRERTPHPNEPVESPPRPQTAKEKK